MKYGLFIICIMIGFGSKAQLYQKDYKFHLGMKAGLGPTFLLGDELKNSVAKISFQGGIFFKHKLGGSLHIQSEALASYKGSKFNNGVNRYERVSLLYLDFPQYLQIDVSNKKNKHNVFFGPQAGFLVASEVYVNGAFKAKYRDLSLKQMDAMGVVGYQFNGYYTGFQVAFKYGLVDINKNLNFIDVLPETGTGKTIRNAAIDFSFLF
jgi:hypothetical protein